MTDRFHSLTVVLEQDIRSDDAENLMQAIKMMKSVINVRGNVSDPESYMAEERARYNLGRKLLGIVFPK